VRTKSSGRDRETKVLAEIGEDSSIAAEVGGIIGRVISTASSPTFHCIEIWLMPGIMVKPGQMVAAKVEDEAGNSGYLLCRVQDAHEVNPHQDAESSTVNFALPFDTTYAPEGTSTVIYRVAKSEPLEEVVLDADGHITEIHSPETLAKAGNSVHEVGHEIVAAALGLPVDPREGIHIGHLPNDESAEIVLKKESVQRHVFIGGGIGSGKSYTRGVLAEELHCLGIPQVNLDINGEMIEATIEMGGENIVPGKGTFKVPLSALSPGDILDALPAINPTSNMSTLVVHAHECLLREVYEGKRAYFGVDDLVKEIENRAPELEMTAKGTLYPAMNRTRSLNRLDFLGKPFDWVGNLTPGKIINIDCRGMLLSHLRLIAASIMRDLQNLAKAQKIPFTILSIDEFHLVAPKDEGTVTTQVLREIARIGRHHRLGLILTTQSPADVDKAILKRLLTRFLHSIEPDQLEALKGVFSDASEEMIKMLPKMPQGVCIVTGAFETIKHATLVRIRTRKTTHGGVTPDIFADLRKRGWTGKKTLEES
jgi:uncharacterized protein